MLLWIFGNVKDYKIYVNERRKMAGKLELHRADVKWLLSLNKEDLPESVIKEGKMTERSLKIDGEEIEFTDGFTDLHTKVYSETLAGRGFGIETARPSVELVYNIRDGKITGKLNAVHPFAGKNLGIK